MTKNEAAWLALRVTGLVVALSGVKQFSAVIYLVWMFASGELGSFRTDVGTRMAFYTTWPGSLGGVILLAFAAYLLFGGRAPHAVLMKE